MPPQDRPQQRQQQSGHFTTFDGVELFYRHWPAVSSTPRGAVVMFHRGHEHSERMAHLVDELQLEDFAFFAWDARGHGHSPGERGYSPGLDASVRDVDDFIKHIEATHGIAVSDIAVVAQSVGAVLVSTWVHDYAPPIRCQVLASPAFKVKLYVPLAIPGLKLLQALRGHFYVNSYVKAKLLTHDPQRVASFDSDPLVSRAISVKILIQLFEAGKRIVADAGAITTPTQLLISGKDWVVHHTPQHRFYENLSSPIKERHVLEGFFHDTLGERDRTQATDRIRAFIERCFATPQHTPCLLDADQVGYTRAEVDRLETPLPSLSPRRAYWSLTRAGLRLGGRLSEGIHIGHQTGFDSGTTLDYVYRHQPQGRGTAGRWIDRAYLESIGWRGIRQRKQHIEALLKQAMALLSDQSLPIHVLDIAAGHGRYVIDALLAAEQRPQSVLLRDYDTDNVAAGQAMIKSAELDDIARFEQGDAFDRESLATLAPAPNLAIVSGLYELFADNSAVRRSLAGLGDAVETGGYLIYTGQPWHPQLEFIARALTSHRGGQAWVMRRRPQSELDQLVAEAGFKKIDQRIDEWGIFTVSLARKVGS